MAKEAREGACSQTSGGCLIGDQREREKGPEVLDGLGPPVTIGDVCGRDKFGYEKSYQKMAQEWRTEAEASRETEEMSG